jgi:hypothetical protein
MKSVGSAPRTWNTVGIAVLALEPSSGMTRKAVCKEIEPQEAIPVAEPMPVQIESPSALEVGVAASAA